MLAALFSTGVRFNLLAILLSVRSHNILPYRLHKFFVLRHLLKRLTNALQNEQLRESRTKLQESLQVLMSVVLFADSLLLQHPKEVFSLQNVQSLLLVLRLDVLLVCHISEEFGSSDVVFKKIEHQHDHNLHTLLVQTTQVQLRFGRLLLTNR